ncbi:hypothetical protein [Neobacillus dielmonensis]|uniref:hypothetical protein n=1 Tax=Neobacillus dielmonensis TaxID=1347369 RepID=UPI0005AB0704|nr:hypothetical protein [Neobacillus dielmonensis]
MEWNSLIFIGEQMKGGEWRIIRRPNPNDLALLLFQSPQRNTTYQVIPLNNENSCIHFYDTNIHMTCDNQSLQVFVEDREPDEQQVIDLLTSIALKDGNRIAVLRMFPKCKNRRQKQKLTRTVSEEKALY